MRNSDEIRLLYRDVTLYNLPELRRRLDLKTDTSSPQVILEGYRRRGEALFTQLNGDFAIVLQDRRLGRIIAARDPLSLRPLYYVKSRGQYRFARSIDELLQIRDVKKSPNFRALRRFIHLRAIGYEETLYEGIFRVPPAHILRIDRSGTPSLRRYWFPEEITLRYDLSIAEAAERFEALFGRAILRRKGALSETAFELSGGLDSSSVLVQASSLLPRKPLDAYSLTFPRYDCDESGYLESFDSSFPLHRHRFEITDDSLPDISSTLPYHPHWPQTTTFGMYLPMFKRMQADGKQIILSGQGGDHLLGGDLCLLGDLLRRRRIRDFLKELPALHHAPFRPTLACTLPPGLVNPFKRFKARLSPREGSEVFEPIEDLFALRELDSPLRRHALAPLLDAGEILLRDANLFQVAREHFGLEYRHPFFDKELVEFLLSLPPEYKYSRGWNKLLLRYTLAERLPPAILSRRDKADFAEVLRARIARSDPQRFFRKSILVAEGLLSASELQRLHHAWQRQNRSTLPRLWALFNLEHWYRHHFAT